MLNAFRHQRFLHSGFDTAPPRRIMCSTPFGIRGFCTVVFATARGGAAPYAQRLSASEVFAHYSVRYSAHYTAVLNAFRHQRFLHTIGARYSARYNGAQRLSASEVFAPILRLRGPGELLVLNAFRHQRFLHGTLRGESNRGAIFKHPPPKAAYGHAPTPERARHPPILERRFRRCDTAHPFPRS